MNGIRHHLPAHALPRRSMLMSLLVSMALACAGAVPAQATTWLATSPARIIPFPKKSPPKRKAAPVPALLALPKAASKPVPTGPIQVSPQVQFGEWVALDAASYSPSFELGQPFVVTLFWRSLASLVPPPRVVLRLAMSNGVVIAEQTKSLLEPEQEAISYAGGSFTQTFTLLVNQSPRDLPPPLRVELNVISNDTSRMVEWQAAGGATSKKTPFVLATLPRESLQVMGCDSPAFLGPAKSLVIQAPTKGWLVQGYWFGHRGLDIANEDGQPIVAAMPGKVVLAEWSNDGFGFMVKIRHANVQIGGAWMTLETIYAHMNLLFVATDDVVQAGQSIGTVGVTGRTTGPHVHFETRLNGQPVNPFCLLPAQ